MHHKPTYFYISLTISDTLFNSYAEPQILSYFFFRIQFID